MTVGVSDRLRRLLAAAALYGVLAHVVALVFWARHGGESIGFGFGTRRTAAGWEVSGVVPEGPAAKALRAGDVLLAFQGDERVRVTGLAGRGRELAPGAAYRVRVLRRGAERDVVLQPYVKTRPLGDVLYYAIVFLTSLAFLGTAFLIAARRADEGVPLLAAAGLYLSSFSIVRNVAGAPWNSLSDTEAAFYTFFSPLVSPFHLSVLIAFFVRFPSRLGNQKIRTWVERIALVSGLVIWLGCEGRGILSAIRKEAIADFYARTAGFWALFWDLLGPANLVLFATLATLVYRNLRLAQDPDSRRRLRWVSGGAFLTIVPWMALFAGDELGLFTPESRVLASRLANLSLIAVPVTTGTAIVRDRLFDLNVAIRRTLQYLLARRVLEALMFVPLAGLGVALYRSRDRTLGQLLFESQSYVYVLATAALVLLFRKRLLLWLDRRFFRAAYDRERLLVSLSERLTTMDSLEEISREVHRSLEEALHPKSLIVLEREPARASSPVVAFSSGGLPAEPIAAEVDELFARMEGVTGAMEIPHEPRDGSGRETTWLAERGVALAVPIALPEGPLTGLLLLGERRSEEPYATSDRTLLLAVARQMAIVRENARLRESVKKEKQLSHELLSRYDEDRSLVRECSRCDRCFDGSLTRCPHDDGPLTIRLPVPRVVDKRYVLEQRLGKGGMGAVYTATDQRLGREVAVKVVITPLLQGQAGARRFEREARAAARLVHPNVVAVHDYGTFEPSGAYLVMELVRGKTLRQLLLERVAIHPADAAVWFGQLMDGVAAAHAAGVIHRDLKPENVILTRDTEGRPLVKVLDFGIAKVTMLDLSAADNLTIPGTVVGTLGYMSPEQISGEEIDQRSDVFALGVLLFETLTGSQAFRGRTLREVASATVNVRPILPGNAIEVLEMNELLSRCLSVRRDERPPSVSALKAEMLPLLARLPDLGRRGPAADQQTTVVQ